MIVLIVLVTAAAAAALTAAAGVLLGRREAALERRLAGYERVVQPPQPEHAPETAVVQHAVDMTARVAERAGILPRVEAALEEADLPLRSAEVIFYSVVLAVMLSLVVTLLSGAFGGLLAGTVTICTPFAWIAGRRRRRLAAFERQLPDTLALLAGSLRAGFSFMQGLEAVAQEIGPPMRRELQRVFTEARLGRPPEDALADAAARMGSKDLMWTVMAIKIQREVGGNLATLLDTVADTMQKRERIRREVRALTAEGRFSAVILSLAPPAVGVGLYLLQPSYIKTLFDHAVGLGALVGAVVLAIAGFFWLRRIIYIEV